MLELNGCYNPGIRPSRSSERMMAPHDSTSNGRSGIDALPSGNGAQRGSAVASHNKNASDTSVTEAGGDRHDAGTDEAAAAALTRSPQLHADRGPGGDKVEEPGEQLEPGASREYFLIRADDPKNTLHRALRHGAILGLLVFSGVWGTLAREGLVALNTYSGASVEPTIWAQAVGCLIMGWTVANKELLETWYPPAFIMLGTGFCGSLTTFSSFILHVFQAYGNQLHYDRHGLHNVMDALSQTALTIGMSLIALAAGRALSEIIPLQRTLYMLERATTHKALRRRARNQQLQVAAKLDDSEADGKSGGQDRREQSRKRLTDINASTPAPYSVVPDLISIAVGLSFWLGAAILCGLYSPFRSVTYSIVMGPVGTILRWYLSRWNSLPASKRLPYWPLGTLAANLLATAVIAGVFVGQHVGRVAGLAGGGAHTVDGCHALHGMQEGFCGCLSTISTFAVELTNLRPRRRAFGYALGSYVIGIAICVLIIGAPWWSIGMDGSCVGIIQH